MYDFGFCLGAWSACVTCFCWDRRHLFGCVAVDSLTTAGNGNKVNEETADFRDNLDKMNSIIKAHALRSFALTKFRASRSIRPHGRIPPPIHTCVNSLHNNWVAIDNEILPWLAAKWGPWCFVIFKSFFWRGLFLVTSYIIKLHAYIFFLRPVPGALATISFKECLS